MKSIQRMMLRVRSDWKKFEFSDRKILQAHVASFAFLLAFLRATFGILLTLGLDFGFLLAITFFLGVIVVLFGAIFVIVIMVSVVTVIFAVVSVVPVKDLSVVEIVTLAAEHCQRGNRAPDHVVGHTFHG